MNKITFGLILLVITSLHCPSVHSGELCDCYGECVPVYQRNVSVYTKRQIKIMYGYLSYAQMEIDHKIPLCLGGSNNIENLQPLSKNDHKIKTDHDLMLFNYVRQCMMTIKEAQSEVNNWK